MVQSYISVYAPLSIEDSIMRGGEFDKDYEPSDKKCPVCGETYNTKVSGKHEDPRSIIGVGDSVDCHVYSNATFIHKN